MITVKQMRQLEKAAQKRGVFAADLMENAGREFVSFVRRKYDLAGKHIIVFSGQGNNGGDGFAAARYFAEINPTIVLFFGKKEKLSEEALDNYQKAFGRINIVKVSCREDLEKFQVQDNLKLVLVDALLGTGTKGNLHEPMLLAIDYFNSLKGIKISLDVPSGLDADTGENLGKYCFSDFIITFHDIKAGLERMKDKTAVIDIGLGQPLSRRRLDNSQ